jgi:hypothetical protein
MQNGFGVVVQQMGIDSGPAAALYYKGTNQNPVLVWPCLGTSGYPILFTNDIALMIATKPTPEGHMGNRALIVVQGNGPAMDISDDVLKLAKVQTDADFKKTLGIYSPLRLIETEGKMNVTYVARMGSGAPSSLEFPITWDQVFEIIKDVRMTGKTNKVTDTDVPYLQKYYPH